MTPKPRGKIIEAIIWLVAGPAMSLVAGYGAFLVLAFVVGPGFDLEGSATGPQRFSGALALPTWLVLFTVGTIASVRRARTIWRRDS